METLKCGLYECFKNIEATNTSKEEGESEPLKEKSNYPIVTAAIDLFINSIDNECIFDYVILDEASDMDIVTGALAFARGKNIIVIDDLNELQTRLDETITNGLMEAFDRNEVNPGYKYIGNSLISSLNQLFEHVPKTVLTNEHRPL